MADSALAETVFLLANTNKIISKIQQLRGKILPDQCSDLIQKIRVTKRSANTLLLAAHVSLRDKIAYEQQSRSVTRQMNVLNEIESQRVKWAAVLEKAKEQRKQLKRLRKVQQEYEITSRLPSCDEDSKNDLEKRMVVAMDRSLKAQQKYCEIAQEVKAVMEKMEENSEWRRKQDDLDEKAMERAKEVATRKLKVKAKAKAKTENGLQSQGKAKQNGNVRPKAGGKGKTQR